MSEPTGERGGYCPTCRVSAVPGHHQWRPPYAVVHIDRDLHIHPITRESVEMQGSESEQGPP